LRPFILIVPSCRWQSAARQTNALANEGLRPAITGFARL
jgi:hypothetical protein